MENLGNLPTNEAELQLFNFVEQLALEGSAWFNLDIPGTNEIDCLVWFAELGMYSIEVKAFRIDDFSSISTDNITYSNRTHQQKYGHKPPPWKQARNAARIISSYLTNSYNNKQIFDKTLSKNECVPFIDSCVYFPYISESEFVSSYPKAAYQLIDFIIFNECHTNEEYLVKKLNRLKEVRIRNTTKEGFISNFLYKSPDYEKLINIYKEKLFLSTPESSIEEKYDFKLLKLLESNDLKKEVSNINFDYPIYRFGYAGTGKTLIALRILQHLAIQEKNVLFTCYNKVLATDLKRFNKLSHNISLRYFDNITIKDIHDLIIEYSPFNRALKRNKEQKIDDTFFESLVDGIINSGYFKGVFEFIVIDEAQDLKDYGWRLLLYLAKSEYNSLIVLNGKEQNLYLDEPSIYLKRFEDIAKKLNLENNLKDNVKQKKRIYRNKTRTFLFAHAFLDHFPESKSAIDFILKNEAKKDPTLEFERNLGNFPFIISRSKELIESSLKKTIIHCLEENKASALGESGILIIVPWRFNPKFPELAFYRNIAVKVLNELKLDFIDYTIEENRRLDYLINQVRIVSYHSCRGIEANFSLILGFEELFNLSIKANCDYHKLGYIILSRAKYETYLFIDPNRYKADSSKFMDFSANIFENIAPNSRFLF